MNLLSNWIYRVSWFVNTYTYMIIKLGFFSLFSSGFWKVRRSTFHSHKQILHESCKRGVDLEFKTKKIFIFLEFIHEEVDNNFLHCQLIFLCVFDADNISEYDGRWKWSAVSSTGIPIPSNRWGITLLLPQEEGFIRTYRLWCH